MSFTQACILGVLWWSPLVKGVSWEDAWHDASIWTGSSAGALGCPPPYCAKGAGHRHDADPLCPKPRRSRLRALPRSQRKLDFLGVCFLLSTGICFCMSTSIFHGPSLLIYSPLIAEHLYAIAHRTAGTDEHGQALTAAKAEYQSVPGSDSNGRTESPSVSFPQLSLSLCRYRLR